MTDPDGHEHDRFMETQRTAIANALRRLHAAGDEQWGDFAVAINLMMCKTGLDLSAITGELRGMTAMHDVSDVDLVRLAGTLCDLCALIVSLATGHFDPE